MSTKIVQIHDVHKFILQIKNQNALQKVRLHRM